MEDKTIGSIVVDASGNIVLLTATEEIGETLPGSGNVQVFDAGIVLRGNKPLGSPHTIKADAGLRVASSVGEVLRLLEQTGVDLTTRPEKPVSQLNALERIERLEKAATAK